VTRRRRQPIGANLDSEGRKKAFSGTNRSAIVGVHPVDPWTNLGEEVIELAFIQSKIALEPNLIEAELLNQSVKFSVERPVLGHCGPKWTNDNGTCVSITNMHMQHKEGCPEYDPW